MAADRGTAPPQLTRSRGSRLLGMPALAGIVFSLSWIVGLSIFSVSADVRSSGADLYTAYAGHQAVATAQFVFTEGIPAIALALVVLTLARAAGQAGERRAGRTILATGLGAAAISLVLCGLGFYLVGRAIPDHRLATAASVNDAINRLDGVKMFLLAVVAATSFVLVRRSRPALPRWTAWVSLALAVTIATSGIGYAFLLTAPALAAWVSLPLLLVWVTSMGVILSRRGRVARLGEDAAVADAVAAAADAEAAPRAA